MRDAQGEEVVFDDRWSLASGARGLLCDMVERNRFTLAVRIQHLTTTGDFELRRSALLAARKKLACGGRGRWVRRLRTGVSVPRRTLPSDDRSSIATFRCRPLLPRLSHTLLTQSASSKPSANMSRRARSLRAFSASSRSSAEQPEAIIETHIPWFGQSVQCRSLL